MNQVSDAVEDYELFPRPWFETARHHRPGNSGQCPTGTEKPAAKDLSHLAAVWENKRDAYQGVSFEEPDNLGKDCTPLRAERPSGPPL